MIMSDNLGNLNTNYNDAIIIVYIFQDCFIHKRFIKRIFFCTIFKSLCFRYIYILPLNYK